MLQLKENKQYEQSLIILYIQQIVLSLGPAYIKDSSIGSVVEP
jgi:hypothetical protein